jgi:NAD(P)-dependent dehydrogenase (short-subunit alcohol dehydrogenase family)
VDLAVFAAGINDISPLGQTSNESWDRVVDVNLSAAFRFAKSMESRLVEGSGKLIFISSIMATHPYPNRLAYAASKGGLESLTRALAIEADGRFSTIAIRLGHVDALMASTKTNPKILEEVKELTPGKSLTSPKEVADLIAGILPSIKLLNGSIIDADRGYTLNRWPPGLAQ